MFCENLPPQPMPQACLVYRPGDLKQDIYTIPLEALAVLAVSSIKPPKSPRWPFDRESATRDRQPSRHPGSLAAGLALGVAVPLTGTVLHENPRFPVMTHLRGLIHTHLLTEVLTSAAKNSVGRKRPFYDTVQQRGEASVDDRRSFFSGHSSHSFAFATYATQLAFDALPSRPTAWLFASLLNSTAAWVASSRAIDGQHNWSDVLTGVGVGATLGYLTYQRVALVSGYTPQVSVSPAGVTLSVPLK